MQIYKTKFFHKWTKEEKITEANLRAAAEEIIAGLVDANLGGGLYKKRFAAASKGKRGGARVLLAYKREHRIIFLYGFAKNEIDNITKKETEALKKLADYYLVLTDLDVKKALKVKELMEVKL